MNIQTAYILTKTNSKTELAKALGFKRPSAIYQWDENKIPETSEVKILKLAGLYPNDGDILKAVIESNSRKLRATG